MRFHSTWMSLVGRGASLTLVAISLALVTVVTGSSPASSAVTGGTMWPWTFLEWPSSSREYAAITVSGGAVFTVEKDDDQRFRRIGVYPDDGSSSYSHSYTPLLAIWSPESATELDEVLDLDVDADGTVYVLFSARGTNGGPSDSVYVGRFAGYGGDTRGPLRQN